MTMNWPRLVVSAGRRVANYEQLSSISQCGPSKSSGKILKLLRDLEEMQELRPATVDAVALLVSEQLRRLRREFPQAAAEWAESNRQIAGD